MGLADPIFCIALMPLVPRLLELILTWACEIIMLFTLYTCSSFLLQAFILWQWEHLLQKQNKCNTYVKGFYLHYVQQYMAYVNQARISKLVINLLPVLRFENILRKSTFLYTTRTFLLSNLTPRKKNCTHFHIYIIPGEQNYYSFFPNLTVTILTLMAT